MTAFGVAADSLFADQNLGLDAVYRVGGLGLGSAVRVMRRAPDQISSFGEGRFVTDAMLIDVRVAEAPSLTTGDTFQIGAELFRVLGEPARDPDRLIWVAEAQLQ